MNVAATDLADAAGVPCERCGYDVRAQPADGWCPECEASVAESRRMAAIPWRPAWRDSDPRWRRRVLAGVWALVALPGPAFLAAMAWDRSVPMPRFFAVQGVPSLGESFLPMVWPCLAFAIGVVLLFARERGRRVGRLDWTRRWGVTASYGALGLGLLPSAYITALVTLGIGAMFQGIPLRYQPGVTDAFVRVGVSYLRHGPHPGRVADVALPACAAVVVLLACAPLFDALRSVGRRGWAIAVPLPLALLAVRQLVYLAIDVLRFLPPGWNERQIHPFFFDDRVLAEGVAWIGSKAIDREFVYEAAKWLACVAIAARLSVAQAAARGGRKAAHRHRSTSAGRSARSTPMETAHPQLAELEKRIAWFLDHPEFDQCVVVEPESQSIVRLRIPLKSMRGFREARLGRIMEVELTPDEAIAGEPILRKIGFEPHGHRKGTFDGVRNAVFPEFVKATTRAKLAAGDVTRVMEDVFNVGHAWLWTFHLDDPNQWPDPLPKPTPWPPAVASGADANQ